jgi:hypothetical protein
MTAQERGAYAAGVGVPLALTETVVPNAMAAALIKNEVKGNMLGNFVKPRNVTD